MSNKRMNRVKSYCLNTCPQFNSNPVGHLAPGGLKPGKVDPVAYRLLFFIWSLKQEFAKTHQDQAALDNYRSNGNKGFRHVHW